MVANNVCRCCLSEACFKDISNEYVNGDKKEVYAEMLLKTFNLHISYQGSNSRLICEECVARLRDAAAFRWQVIQVEETIISSLAEGLVTKSDNTFKPEQDDFIDHITGEFDAGSADGDVVDDDDDENCSGDNFHYWAEDDVKQENGDDKMLVIKLDPEEDIRLQLLQESDARHAINENKNQNRRTARPNRLLMKNKPERPIKAAKPKKQMKILSQSDRKENSLTLLNYSNICLFESLKTRFRCFYCKNSYLYITDLREHTLTHSNASYLKMCINRLQGMSYKCVDISNLACKICSENLTDLADLKTHLTEKHDIKFSGEENVLIQYRLVNGFKCVMCNQEFQSFYRLSVHMNTHYMYHVCEICGASYINRLSLRMHVSSRHTEKKCSFCPATFTNAYLRIKHLRKEHDASKSKRYCLLCNKTFRYTYMLEEHKIQEHGKKRPLSVCSECGKTFLSPVNLRTHIRCVHKKERNHPCTHCGMSFFTSCDRRRHERTHQDLRSFACSNCGGRFKSKDSLRRHLKRQHGHLFNP